MQKERARASLPGWLDGLYDPDEMRAADRFAMERRGILELELAEKAGAGLAAAAAEVAGGRPIRVVVGSGNNGGDGLISARLLREAGHEVDVMAPIALNSLAGVPRTNLERLPGAPPRPFDPAALGGEIGRAQAAQAAAARVEPEAAMNPGLLKPSAERITQVVVAPGNPVALGSGASGALATNGTGSVLEGWSGRFWRGGWTRSCPPPRRCLRSPTPGIWPRCTSARVTPWRGTSSRRSRKH